MNMRLVLLAIVLAVLALLGKAFPYTLQNEDAYLRALYLLTIISALCLRGRSVRLDAMPRILRDVLIWVALFLGCVLLYSYRDLLSHNRLLAELVPQSVQVASDGSLRVRASEGGHFFIEANVNHVPVRFMVDTGASDIVLTPQDAERAGFDVKQLDYSRMYETANGTGSGAVVMLHSLGIGTLHLSNLPASVNHAPMESSLLGMRFLRELSSYRVEGNTLILVP